MKAIVKHSANYFCFALALFVMLISGCNCSAPKPAPDPLSGWTFKPLPGWELPPYGNNTNSLSKAIIDDYQDFISNNKLILNGAITGFYENKLGQQAVEFEAFIPNDYVSWHYVLIYNDARKRIKVMQYGRTKYQS
jgi:hypothetical protein